MSDPGPSSRGRLWTRILRWNPRAEVDDELAFHVDERVREYVARGMDPDAARAAALERMGELDDVRGECTKLLAAERRSEARRERLNVSWLDFKLGFRMLVRYPGLTVVGGLSMAFAIAVGAASFEFVTQTVHPTLPLDEGDRIVGVVTWDVRANRTERRTVHDFVTWRDELQTIEDLGAFRALQRNLIVEDGAGEPAEEGRAEPVEVAEISASAFRVARTPALLGRFLVEEDEESGAPPVVVIGHRVWQTRFDGDPDVVGRTVRLGDARSTIVGVMPEGFAFPIAHSLWVPLRLADQDPEPLSGPAIRVFGRRAPGSSARQAQAELDVLAARASRDFPDTHEHLRPEVVPYGESFMNIPWWYSAGVNVFLLMFVVLVCGNVALLLFARAATREGEILVRTALGASRARIVTQFLSEAAVLAALAAALGLAVASVGLKWAMGIMETTQAELLPFWFDDSLSPGTLVYAALLAALGAAIAGVLPALKVTGRGVGSRLRQVAAGAGGLRFGGVWTLVIVAQVAVTVAFPASAFFVRRDAVQLRSVEVGFAEEEYLSARIDVDRDPASTPTGGTPSEGFPERLEASAGELERRLSDEPAVAALTFATHLPRMRHPQRRIEVEDDAPPRADGPFEPRVSSAAVAPEYFEVLGAPVLSGRAFHAGDLESSQGVVIANLSFVNEVLGGGNPIGRRVRYLDPEEGAPAAGPDGAPGPWHEIVGVVPDLSMTTGGTPGEGAGLYHPLARGGAAPLHIAVRVRGDPEAFAPRLRAVAAEVDPGLRLSRIVPIEDIPKLELEEIRFWFRLLVLVSSLALLLSLAGIFSVMSFTVSRRTREIGIRVALGAKPRRVIGAVFARPLTQVGAGVVAGAALTGLLMMAILGPLSGREVAIVAAYALLMMGVCMLACIVPTRRALRVDPSEALKAEG